MIRTENVSPVTSFTVSDTPSSATEPFGAMNFASGFGTRNTKRAMPVMSSRETTSASPSMCPLTRWPPSSSPTFSDRSRLTRVPFDQRPTAVSRSVSAAASTVLYRDVQTFLKRDARYTYGTKGTPTTESLEVAWTELTGGAGTVLLGSGLAAISLALMSCLHAGDHLLVTDSVYRPTRNFCDTVLKRFGRSEEHT